MQRLNVRDFTLFPGPRYIKLGEYSGEWFREKVLIPLIKSDTCIILDLDGVAGYGSSFLEEAFGGCIRSNIEANVMRAIVENLVSKDDPDLIYEIKDYVEDAIAHKAQNNGNI
ncbi:MAG: STAS-like domain-containing protein [Haemophilus influenzae]|nr:STAS-like domain-containing protein [Haemophilus influenzae]